MSTLLSGISTTRLMLLGCLALGQSHIVVKHVQALSKYGAGSVKLP